MGPICGKNLENVTKKKKKNGGFGGPAVDATDDSVALGE